jgi:predicted Zn-dependent protease
MNKHSKRCAALLLALCTLPALPLAVAKDQGQVVQDGIAVKPLKRSMWRDIAAPEQSVNEASAQQYVALMSQARDKGVLVPESDPQVRRLRAIAQRIIPNTARWNQDARQWQWQVNLLRSDQVNAFCMPGGRIAFYTGIIDKLRLTDDEIAAVMGHEIAHALREHGRDRQSKATATSMITGIAARLGGAALSAWLGIDPNLTGRVAETAGQMYVLKFSRDEEREADLVGLDIAARSGFDPRAGLSLWTKMGQLEQGGAPIELLSDHPGGDNRMRQIQDHMNVLLPLYARAKGTTVDRLPPYRTNVAER